MENQKKVCNKCNEEKYLSEFYTNKINKDGYMGYCKLCKSNTSKQKYLLNIKVIKEKSKQYRLNNPEYYKKYSKEYYKKNKKNFNSISKEYYKNNSSKVKKNSRNWKAKNKSYVKDWAKQYCIRNREKYNKYIRDKRLASPIFKLKGTLRTRLGNFLRKKKYIKKNKTENILGISYKFAMLHIEKQFKEGMRWNNHGKWHIDHVIPLESAKTEQELLKLFHYTNLQPLWAKDNLEKSNKIVK